MKHDYHDSKSYHGGGDCTNPGCMICDGGLGICKICHSLEGGLTVDCPGVKVPPTVSNLVYNGSLDFFEGLGWVVLERCIYCNGRPYQPLKEPCKKCEKEKRQGFKVAFAFSNENESALKNFVTDLAEHGVRHDTSPTMQFGKGEAALAGRYTEYIRRIDEAIRSRAKEQLTRVNLPT